MQNTAEQNYPGSVTSCDARPENETDLLYNTTERTQGMWLGQTDSKMPKQLSIKVCAI